MRANLSLRTLPVFQKSVKIEPTPNRILTQLNCQFSQPKNGSERTHLNAAAAQVPRILPTIQKKRPRPSRPLQPHCPHEASGDATRQKS